MAEATSSKSPLLAGILSGLMPGLGQFYCRQWGKGAAFLVGAVAVDATFGVSAEFLRLLPSFRIGVQPENPSKFLIGSLLFLAIAIWSIMDAVRTAREEGDPVDPHLLTSWRHPMRFLSALLVGFFSGFLLYMMAAMLFISSEPSPGLVLATFLGGWAVSTYLVQHGTQTTAKVWARGGLLGAAEWMAIGIVAVLFSGKTLVQTTEKARSSAEVAGASLGAGLFSMIGLGVAVFMAIVCLIIYFIASRTQKEFAVEPARRKCPQCAELIAAEAKKCRFCGTILA